jgi:hypothetical protein
MYGNVCFLNLSYLIYEFLLGSLRQNPKYKVFIITNICIVNSVKILYTNKKTILLYVTGAHGLP